jgi:hypothetical protein
MSSNSERKYVRLLQSYVQSAELDHYELNHASQLPVN